ncbi:MAG: SEC-C domain-containing protein [Actinobacteria bacterium]|nr:SEC-C domain-containing protein [Actinomycetota bacterium]
MGAAGRNERCRCGSGRKAKRCCGVQRGPSEADLARAFLAGQVRPAARLLRGCSDAELNDLAAEMIELPTIDTSLQLPLPRLLTPDVDRLLVAIEEDDLDEIDAALPPVLARVDTPVARADLARAVVRLRERGRIDPKVAAVALIELSAPKLQRLTSSAVVQAAGVALGDVATPSGLLMAR